MTTPLSTRWCRRAELGQTAVSVEEIFGGRCYRRRAGAPRAEARPAGRAPSMCRTRRPGLRVLDDAVERDTGGDDDLSHAGRLAEIGAVFKVQSRGVSEDQFAPCGRRADPTRA